MAHYLLVDFASFWLLLAMVAVTVEFLFPLLDGVSYDKKTWVKLLFTVVCLLFSVVYLFCPKCM